jgi:predicted kinase
MLIIFGGLPGTGKSTLAQRLAAEQQALYLRIDTIEQSLRDAAVWSDGPAGYMVAYNLAVDNLRLGLSVVADSVNPLEVTRRAWRNAAEQANVSFIEIEVVCSDKAEHRRRVETRTGDIPGHTPPSWHQVVAREYEPWPEAHVVIDTATLSPSQSIDHLRTLLRIKSGPGEAA